MRASRGFTLLQIIIAMVIIGILSATLLIRLPSYDTFNVQGFASQFLEDLRLTSVLSLSENQRYRLVVGPTAAIAGIVGAVPALTYQIQDETGTPFANPETGSTSPTAFAAGVSSVAITSSALSPALTTTAVIFDGLGQPYYIASGVITPFSSGTLTFTLTAGTATATVSVTPQTGYMQ